MAISTKRKQPNNKDIYSTMQDSDMSTMTTAPQNISVEEAKKVLRQARLAEHEINIAEALRAKNREKLATACSGFLALYRNSQKKPTDKSSQKGKNEKH